MAKGRYKDTLQLETVTGQTRNEVGDLQGGRTSWETLTKCREYPAGAGKTLSATSAKTIEYSSNVFFPSDAPAVPLNARVRILNEHGEVQVEGIVLRYKRYAHYGRIWI